MTRQCPVNGTSMAQQCPALPDSDVASHSACVPCAQSLAYAQPGAAARRLQNARVV
jgi:hypothetical protein